MAANGIAKEVLPPALDSTSEPPPMFDGTTRLYMSYTCPYAQRVWITRNCKGLQDQIKLVPIVLLDRPNWYKEKVYPRDKLPSLEYKNEIIGESIDLMKFLDSNFEGPSLLPDDPAKREFAEELILYCDLFSRSIFATMKGEGIDKAASGFEYLENALSKYDEGPFFLGDFSLVDIAYVPFVERYHPYILRVFKHDLTVGRPKLAAWIEEMGENENYTQTREDPEEQFQSLLAKNKNFYDPGRVI